LSLLMLLASCSFGHQNFDQAGGSLTHPNDFVIQLDDYGSFWDAEIPARALETIAQSARTTNTVVVLFVHGWHHNAAADDGNAVDFARSLNEIRRKLDDNVDGQPGIYRRSRQVLTGNGEVNVIGIYVGWRGKSLPVPLSYITFWDRKNAAERIGDGDLREFLLRLNSIYRANYQGREPSSPYMGMTSIAHSFGAQILFKAIASTLEKELLEVTGISPNAAGPKPKLAKPLEGFGDIVILINPAVEAFQFERIRTLAAQVAYDRRQPPLLLVLSAATDVPRRVFFPAGRWIYSIFRAPLSPEKTALLETALGEYEPQRTHTITLLPELHPAAAAFDSNDLIARPCDIVNFDLTDIPTIARVRLEPIAGRHLSYSPFLIGYGGTQLILGHSGIFAQELVNFTNDYVGITRAKRLLLADPKMRDCLEPAQIRP
jgi:hypothetical protein